MNGLFKLDLKASNLRIETFLQPSGWGILVNGVHYTKLPFKKTEKEAQRNARSRWPDHPIITVYFKIHHIHNQSKE